MFRFVPVAAVSIMLLFSALCRAAGPPDRVFSPMNSVYPTFVAADSVLTAEGEVDPALFSPQDAGIIARRLAKSGSRCLEILASPTCGIAEAGKPVADDLATFVESAERVFVGKVLSATPGFLRFDPGSLLEVSADRMLQGDPEGFDSYYVFMEVGTFRVGRTEFCATAPQHAAFPEIGDEVLIIVQPNDWNDRFLFIEFDRGFFSFQDGEVSLPKHVVSSDPQLRYSSKDAFIELVASVIRGPSDLRGDEP